MEIKYRVLSEVMDLMIAGKKTVEVRLLNGKSMYIKPGTKIIFTDFDNEDRHLKVEVTNKKDYDNLDDLLMENDINQISPNSTKEEIDKLLNDIFMDNYKTSKLVAITFKLI